MESYTRKGGSRGEILIKCPPGGEITMFGPVVSNAQTSRHLKSVLTQKFELDLKTVYIQTVFAYNDK